MLLKKFNKVAFLLIIFITTFVASTTQSYAAFNNQCGFTVNPLEFEAEYGQGYGNISVEIESTHLTEGDKYFLAIFRAGSAQMWRTAAGNDGTINGSKISLDVDIPTINDSLEDGQVYLMKNTNLLPNEKICQLGTVNIKRSVEVNCDVNITQVRNVGTEQTPINKSCSIQDDPERCVEKAAGLKISAKMTDQDGKPISNKRVNFDISQDKFCFINCYGGAQSNSEGIATVDLTPGFYPGGSGNFLVRISLDSTGGDYIRCPDVNYNLSLGKCAADAGGLVCKEDTGLKPISGITDDTESANPYNLCKQIPNPALRTQCETCAGGPFGRDGVWTAVGCINRDPKSIVQSLMQIGLGMGGGVALISVLAGGFILSTSQGEPQKANQAKEIITNSIIGLLFILFSVVILQFIGVTIFNIPGFGSVK